MAASQIPTKSQKTAQVKVPGINSDTYFKPQQGTAVDSAKRQTRNGKGNQEPRWLVLTDTDDESSRYYHVDIDNKRHFPEGEEYRIATRVERMKWDVGQLICLFWPNIRGKLVRSPAEIVKIFDNEQDAQEEAEELARLADERSRLAKERNKNFEDDRQEKSTPPSDNGHDTSQFQQDEDADKNESERSISQQSDESNEDFGAGDGQEEQIETPGGINHTIKNYIDQTVEASNQKIHDKYIPVLQNQAEEIKRLNAQLKKVRPTMNGKETVRRRLQNYPILSTLITDDEADTFPKWMTNNVVPFVNENYLKAPDPKKCFTTLSKAMWGEDLSAFAYKSKSKPKDENEVGDRVGKANNNDKDEEEEKEDGVYKLPLNDRDPTGLEVYKKVADIYFTKIVLPETKLEHERKRQLAMAAINAGKSDVYVPPQFGSAEEHSARAIFVHAKLISLNDVGGDSRKRAKIDVSKFQELIDRGYRPTADFELEKDNDLKKPFLERLVEKRKIFKEKEKLKAQQRKAKKQKTTNFSID